MDKRTRELDGLVIELMTRRAIRIWTGQDPDKGCPEVDETRSRMLDRFSIEYGTADTPN